MALGLRLFLFCVHRYKGSWKKQKWIIVAIFMRGRFQSVQISWRYPNFFPQLMLGGYSLKAAGKIKLEVQLLPRSHWSFKFTRFITNNLN